MSVITFDIKSGICLYEKSNYQTDHHQHYPIEIIVSQEGTFKITSSSRTYKNLKSVIIPSNLPHSFDCIGARCQLLFLDPLSTLGRKLTSQYNLQFQSEIIPNLSGLDSLVKDKKQLVKFASKIDIQTDNSLDERITNCIEAIHKNLCTSELTISQLTSFSYLSESRLSHLFKQQLGISIRQYILWKKISLAVIQSKSGFSMTECAHYAGFADSSHFNKVFYKMFGINPSFGLKG